MHASSTGSHMKECRYTLDIMKDHYAPGTKLRPSPGRT